MNELPADLRDLLLAFAEAGVEFVVVGGYAVAFHGHVRATKDIDLLIRPSPDNAERVYAALAVFGAPLAAFEVSAADFATYDGVLRFGAPPYAFDVLNRIAGVSFDEAFETSSVIEVEGVRVRVLGLDALLRAKRAAGRTQDLADAEALERLRGARGEG